MHGPFCPTELRMGQTGGFAKRKPKITNVANALVATFASPPISLSSRLTFPSLPFFPVSLSRLRQWDRGRLASPSSSSYSATLWFPSNPCPRAVSLRYRCEHSPWIPPGLVECSCGSRITSESRRIAPILPILLLFLGYGACSSPS